MKKIQVAIELKKRLQFESTVSRISSRFVRVDNLDWAINVSLADMGLLCQASRAYLFLLRSNNTLMDNTHEWCNHGISAQIQNLQGLAVDKFPWWMEQLNNGKVINIEDVSQMPIAASSEKAILEEQHIKSILVLPMILKGKLAGFIGFDRVEKTKAWSEDTLSLLKVSVEIIGGALERQIIEDELRESESRYRAIFECTGTAMVIIEDDLLISMVNAKFEILTGYRKAEVEQRKKWLDLFPPKWLEQSKDILPAMRLKQAEPWHYEAQIKDRQGTIKDVIITIGLLPGTSNHVATLHDITERKHVEKKLRDLSFHDSLTGVFNRNYFEQVMQSYILGERNSKVALVVCDVDGLKLVNNTMGHNMGDALLMVAARILKESFQPEGIVARIGGDEFGILMPRGGEEELYQACARAKRALTKHNTANPRLFFNLSMGFAYKADNSKTMGELYKEADNNMYREKLLHIQSNRNALVQTFRTTLETRDFIADGHAERLQNLMMGFLKTIESTVHNRANLNLLAYFHDIGKMGIPDLILFKPGPLTEQERKEMQRHSEIGYRIALSSPELAPIADWILKHHEWWNGKGYPLGIKGDEIPTECRVLAIAEAYDAMTSKRPYRQIISPGEAITEIKKCAGTQFDPDLAHRFIKYLNYRHII